MFKINLMLADAAQVAEGKLNTLGAGWDITVPGAPFAVCGIIGIPWDEAMKWHTLHLELIDGDGQPFCPPVPDGEEAKPLAVGLPKHRATIGPHVKPGTTLNWPFAVSIGPGLPLQPGSIYEWRLSINGTTHESWTLPFSTLVAPSMSQAA